MPRTEDAATLAGGLLERFGVLLRLVRFSHTLFALPWALAGLLLGAGGWPGLRVLTGVLGAMAGARTAAMAFNRLVDRDFDARNPRTRTRPSVTGEVGTTAMLLLVVAAGGLFVASAWFLNDLCGRLSLPVLALVLSYSYCKRFTSLSHLVLGACLGLSPPGAYLAARGVFDEGFAASVLLGLAVVAWTAGFDILYACQDVDHDRREGLRSIPAHHGVRAALGAARILHAVVPLSLLGVFFTAGFGAPFLVAVGLVASLLVYEHLLVSADDLSRVGTAFFQVNVAVSLVVLAGTFTEVLLGRGS